MKKFKHWGLKMKLAYKFYKFQFFRYLVILLILLNSFAYGETLFFGVSLFDVKYGPVFRYSFKFWNFESDFYLPMNVALNRGFIKLDFDSDSAIEKFHFQDGVYKVTYDNINSIPFSTFANPASKSWSATWLEAGFYGEFLIYKSHYFSLIGNGEKINIAVKLPFLPFFSALFLERDSNKIYAGLGTDLMNGIYIFAGQKNGIGVNYIFDGPNNSKVLIYGASYLDYDNFFDLSKLETVYGFTLKTQNFEINLSNDYKDNTKPLVGMIKWKVGDVYVIGQFKGEKIRISTEFPIW